MEQALGANEMLVGIIATLIGWGGFLVVVYMLRGFIIAGVTAAAIEILKRGDSELNRQIIKHFADKDVDARTLYDELHERFDGQRG